MNENLNKTLDKIIRVFRFRELFKNLPNNFTSLLDVGCGNKPWFFYFDKNKFKNVKVYGIDSENINFETKPINFSFVSSEISKNLPFENSKFDLITMIAVLEHLDYPDKILKEAHRILKPNGALILTTPSKFAKPILEFLAFKLHLIDAESIASHKTYFDRKSLGKILNQARFIIEKLNYFEFGMNIFAKVSKQ